jgi:hypothetical protein
MEAYHDTEWGVPVRDPRMLWEMLILEGFQAGLSWRTILHRRAGSAPRSTISIPKRSHGMMARK